MIPQSRDLSKSAIGQSELAMLSHTSLVSIIFFLSLCILRRIRTSSVGKG